MPVKIIAYNEEKKILPELGVTQGKYAAEEIQKQAEYQTEGNLEQISKVIIRSLAPADTK